MSIRSNLPGPLRALTPRLSENEIDPEKRSKQLGKSRDSYTYDYSYPDGVAMAARVPFNDTFSPTFLAKVGDLDLDILTNHGASGAKSWFGGDDTHARHVEEVAKKLRALEKLDLKEHLTTVSHAAARRIGDRRPLHVDEYAALYGTIGAPPVFNKFDTHQDSLAAFAWQRLAGPNPMSLRRVTELPANFPVTDAHFARGPLPDDGLSAALSEGRAFLVDYAIFAGAPQGTTGGNQKFLWAPIALFVREKAGKNLMPVAIQCEQFPSTKNPIITPDHGPAWQIARAVLQIADGNLHQSQIHLAHTHLVVEAVIVATKRQLAQRHPIHLLFEPHFEFTLALNEVARTNLIAPGGQVDYVLGSTLEGSIEAVKAGVKEYRLDQRAPKKELASRGIDDKEGLPVYPYRDDGLLIWDLTEEFVRDYLKLYYDGDEAVARDVELRAFLDELGSQTGGRLSGVPKVETLAGLTELVTLVIFTATAQHAAVNFSQFPFMSFIPNMPAAGYAPLPEMEKATEEHFLAILPPLDQAVRQFDITYQLSNLRDSILGHYSLIRFRDPRVHELCHRFKAELELAEGEIEQRNRGRFLPYPFLLPSKIPGSIHI